MVLDVPFLVSYPWKGTKGPSEQLLIQLHPSLLWGKSSTSGKQCHMKKGFTIGG